MFISTKTLIIASLIFIWLFGVAACHRVDQLLPLTDDPDKNSTILREYVPIGTVVAEAKERMDRAGFSCHLKRNERLYTEEYGFSLDGPKLDFLACNRSGKIEEAGRREYVLQQAFFILNDQNQVKKLIVISERPGVW